MTAAGVTVVHGDCLDALRAMPDASVDAVVTDPPYELGFMGRTWDASGIAYSVPLWTECLRVLRPGGHLLAFGGTRTFHRLVCAIEDAGFDIRDSIQWIYGSGFPKSLDVGKAIDKARDDKADIEHVRCHLDAAREIAGVTKRQIAEAFKVDSRMVQKWMGAKPDPQAHCPTWEQWVKLRELLGFGDDMDAEVWRLNGRKGTPGEAWEQREVIGERERKATGRMAQGEGGYAFGEQFDVTAPATDAARQWSGWGTALKPAAEPIVVARKPLIGTVARNVLAHGTGALNVDACRVVHASADDLATSQSKNPGRADVVTSEVYGAGRPQQSVNTAGRWPANVVLSHSPDCAEQCGDGCPVAELDAQSGITRDGIAVQRNGGGQKIGGQGVYGGSAGLTRDDQGFGGSGGASRFFPVFRYQAKAPTKERPKVGGIAHPTVKPLTLLRWMVKLVTPPGGTVLDPFAGSGTTGEAAALEGFRAILVEREAAYLPLIAARLARLDGDAA